MADEISNKTVLILVVLTILISTLGTFTVTSSVKNYNSAQVPVYNEGTPVQSGKVSLSINNPEAVSVEKTSNPVTGNVVLKINS